MGYTRGTIGKSSTGRIRLPQVDEKTKVRISKTLQKNLQKQNAWGGSTTVKKQVSGTASSVAFTPLQVSNLLLAIFDWYIYLAYCFCLYVMTFVKCIEVQHFLQGLEIVNPHAAEVKVNEADAKYFSNTAGFWK